MSRLLPSRFLLPSRRFFASTSTRGAFATGPAPPRLPPKEQEEFERLQRSSTGAFSTPRPQINQSPDSATTSESSTSSAKESDLESQLASATTSESSTSSAKESDLGGQLAGAKIDATGKGDELHPDIRRGAKPEFEGDVNPKTGEVGGPKNEPLRWGEKGDWSYNGRVTDF